MRRTLHLAPTSLIDDKITAASRPGMTFAFATRLLCSVCSPSKKKHISWGLKKYAVPRVPYIKKTNDDQGTGRENEPSWNRSWATACSLKKNTKLLFKTAHKFIAQNCLTSPNLFEGICNSTSHPLHDVKKVPNPSAS
jgi:hypothetical protein